MVEVNLGKKYEFCSFCVTTVSGSTKYKMEAASIYTGCPKKMVRCEMLHCTCHSSESLLFPEIKLTFPEKGLKQHYFPYKRFSERLSPFSGNISFISGNNKDSEL